MQIVKCMLNLQINRGSICSKEDNVSDFYKRDSYFIHHERRHEIFKIEKVGYVWINELFVKTWNVYLWETG